MADQDHIEAVARIALHFHVHLRDQRTGGIEHREPAILGAELDGRGHAMRRENQRGARGHLLQILDEHGAEVAQPIHHMLVVDHFVAHIHRCAEHGQRALDDLDGAIHTGTEAAGIGEQYLHQFELLRRP